MDESQYRSIVAAHLDKTLTSTDLPFPEKQVGKVRDIYRLDGHRLVMIATDRQSAFDRILGAIPFKGAVLNLVSGWWFSRTRHIVPNHLISVCHPQASIVTACTVFPIEFVVRGYITGSTDTSLWTHYEKGERLYCGNVLPEGLSKNEKLAEPIITPTTKEAMHDKPISGAEIVEEGLMSEQEWLLISRYALLLFAFGQQEAARHNLILADTKYEFGKSSDGTIMLVDELHTPDSSRYWIASTYEARMRAHEEPENIDKEFFRLWFKSVCDPYQDETLPEAPDELIIELSLRYLRLYEMITGQIFPFDDAIAPSLSLFQSIEKAAKESL